MIVRAVIVLLAVMLSNPADAAARSWDFSVLLDGSAIGYHRFELTEEGNQRRLTSEASFDVRFLFFNAFRYRHENTELWSDGCLESIESRTRSNGKKVEIRGTREDDRFVVTDGTAENAVQECVMTFAYWNPDFLHQPRLLNPQTGEYLDVDVERVGEQSIVVRDKKVAASVYRVKAKKMQLTLWYSPDNEWLALESVARGGRIIRYELT